MGPELVTVAAGGLRYSAFEHVAVAAGANEAARSFSLAIAAAAGPSATAWVFACGTEVSIYAGGDLLVTGYVDRYQPKLHEHNEAIIHVSGRGKGQDAIDSSAVHETGYFENQNVLQIAQALDKFGIGFKSDQALEPIPHYQITPGETVFRCIEKLCRQQGLVLTGQADGSINITRLSQARNSPLLEGYNCKGLEADHNWAGRHSHVIARGQAARGNGAQNTQIEQTATDDAVGRYRPSVVVIDEDTDATRAQNRAEWRLAREAGHALKAHIEVQGFHDEGGQLWAPGNLTYVDSPFLDVQQDMAIERVEFSQSRQQGSIAHLSLCDPQALGGKGGSAGKSGKAWSSKFKSE
jgi:prophage tail gpP-like protein